MSFKVLKIRIIQKLFIISLFLPIFTLHSQEEEREYFTTESIEAQFSSTRVGAAFASTNNSHFSIGGLDKNKQPTSKVEIITKEGDFYNTYTTELDEAVHFAQAIGHGDYIYLIGGIRNNEASSTVLKLEWDEGKLIKEKLPDLPKALILPGVTTHRSATKHFLFVLGGAVSDTAEKVEDSMYELAITDFNETSQWEEKEKIPGGGKIGAIVRETFNELIISGGWTLEDGSLKLSNTTERYARTARDGESRHGWRTATNISHPVALPAYSKTGNAHITILGGDQSEGTFKDLISGNKEVSPTSAIITYHSPTSTWVKLGDLDQPAYSGVFTNLDEDSSLYISQNNESKATVYHFNSITKEIHPIDWIVIGLYFCVIAFIGYWFGRKKKSAEDFAVGGRSMKWWATAISCLASGISTISFMALPALVASTSLVMTCGSLFNLPGILIGAFITLPLLRRLNLISVYSYLERRFGVKLRMLGSFIGVLTQLMGRIGIVVMLPALAVSSMTGVNPTMAVLLMGIITTVYCTFGGFEAVIWTDVIQGILLLIGFLLLGCIAVMNVEGGFSTIIEHGTEMGRFEMFIWDFNPAVSMAWFVIIAEIIQILTFASDQVGAQRVNATPLKDIRKFAFFTGGYAIFSAITVGFVGLALFGFFKTNPELMTPIMKNEQMVPILMLSKVQVGILGILIATMFAAAMSTVSTSVNSISVLFAEDFFKKYKPEASSKELVRVMQVATIFSGIFGTGIAIYLLNSSLPSMWEGFTRIMSLVGGGFGAVFALGMFTRRCNEYGAIAAIITATSVNLYLQNASFYIHYSGLGIITMLTAMISGYGFSFIFPGEKKELKGLTVWDQISDKESREMRKADEQKS